jgi:hypothetical protein
VTFLVDQIELCSAWLEMLVDCSRKPDLAIIGKHNRRYRKTGQAELGDGCLSEDGTPSSGTAAAPAPPT